MNKVLIVVKNVAQIAVSVGVGIIAGNAIGLVKPKDLNLLKQICVGAGSLILVDLASKKACEHLDAEFDSTVEQVQKIIGIDEIEEENTEE